MREAITKQFKVKNTSNGNIILANCAATENALERMVGLLGRKSISMDEGLWIESCNSIHTLFMRFPIDAVFLDSNGKILTIYRELKPWRMSWIHFRAHSVLELASGQSNRLQLRVGEVLQPCSTS